MNGDDCGGCMRDGDDVWVMWTTCGGCMRDVEVVWGYGGCTLAVEDICVLRRMFVDMEDA